MSIKVKKLLKEEGFVVDNVDELLAVAKYLKEEYGGELKVRSLSDFSLTFNEKCIIKTISSEDFVSVDYKENVDNPKLIGIAYK